MTTPSKQTSNTEKPAADNKSLQASLHTNASRNSTLDEFVTGILGDEHVRVEEDFGGGYVRLKSSEAEKRQAVQDIRSVEDIVLEMLRNSRDAGAKNIFVAVNKEGDLRTIVIIDDGKGIIKEMQERIFQPRVTSKLDSAKLDKWGIHGRGMALFSVSVNAESAIVVKSDDGIGASIKVVTNSSKLSEKTDQSTFPYFELIADTYSMRGPKNILRTVAEFAMEHRADTNVYCGSATEIIATLRRFGEETIPASVRIFNSAGVDVNIAQSPALAFDDEELANIARGLGLDISQRSARRVLDGEIAPLPTIIHRLKEESFPHMEDSQNRPRPHAEDIDKKPFKTKISKTDLDIFGKPVAEAFADLAIKYYLADTQPQITQKGDKLVIEFQLMDEDQSVQ